MAPQIADIIDEELKAGTLVVRRGHFAGVESDGHSSSVTISTSGGPQSFAAARTINCTGPSTNYRRVNSPLFRSLFSQGLVSSGPLAGGFWCAGDGAMIGADGQVSDTLFSLGPCRLGTLFESIAIPEIRCQTLQLAEVLIERLKQRKYAGALPMRSTDWQSGDALLEAPVA